MEIYLQFINEIDVDEELHKLIKKLRNSSFPDHMSEVSYLKQLPHLRCLEHRNGELIGYMGLDYRVVGVGDKNYKVLGVIDFCVVEEARGKGVGSSMLSRLNSFAETKDVDFIILMAEKTSFYERNGFHRLNVASSWLRLHEYKNYGVAFDHLDNFFVKSTGNKKWPNGHVDWLGYMF